MGECAQERLGEWLLLGELSLRRPAGVRARSRSASPRDRGFRGVIVASENAPEAAVVEGLEVRGADTPARCATSSGAAATRPHCDAPARREPRRVGRPDLRDVKGQEHAKRALEISMRPAATICFMVGRPARARRCSPARCRACSRRLLCASRWR